MKTPKQIFAFVSFAIKALIFLNSCTFSQDSGSSSFLTVGTWNTQTFFDARTEGTEYAEFKKSENWNREKYETRLDRLCQVIKHLDCDVLILEEIENEAVIYDISNRLAGHSWNQNKNWNYSVFSKSPGTSIGCGILSRYELTDIKTHSLCIQSQQNKQPSLRPILEAKVLYGNKEAVILANHWKSKSGGSETSEVWRSWQENLLGNRLCFLLNNDPEIPVIMAGDFNRDLAEFEKASLSSILINYFDYNSLNNCLIELQNPWYKKDGSLSSNIGSYYFQNRWERIDHILVTNNCEIKEFDAVASEPWADEKGIPQSYKLYSNQGYSDHLPLKMSFLY